MATINEIAAYHQWVASLKPGDLVGVYELDGRRLVYQSKMHRRTPTGRVVLISGDVFTSDGRERASHRGIALSRDIRPLKP